MKLLLIGNLILIASKSDAILNLENKDIMKGLFMNELLFLGRGSGYHSTESNTLAYIKENETLLLIDCGETVFKKILEKD